MICFKVGPALIAGNTLVLKSSEKAPLTSLLFARLAKEAGVPPGVLNVLSGFGLSLRRCDRASYGYSCNPDSNLKSCTLEFGGKSPLIVFEDADLEKAAKVATFSIVFNSGQVCMSSSRVYVHETVADRFNPLCARATRDVHGRAGDPLNSKTGFGPQAVDYSIVSFLGILKRGEKMG
ncbi:hypothetical protein BBP40_001171 [Aspergillus hancockii]|nr:hypothetical protein BBP40_001171 [Aspergillus hancockii]